MLRGGLKIVSLFFIALYLPQFFLTKNPIRKIFCHDDSQFKLGLENVSLSFLKQLCGTNDLSYAVGLVTNQTGKDQQGRSNIDILQQMGLNIKTIFTPQHGFGLDKKVTNEVPVVSLYDTNHRWLDSTLLQGLDVLIFDVQDAGMRHYSYLNTLLQVLDAAAQHNKIVVVLDRPNLLGSLMEGAIMKEAHERGDVPIPVRYGMTVGELATYFNKHVIEKQANLHVVSMVHYERSAWSKDLPYKLSPQLATIHSCYGYSFLGLIGEVAPFDIGVGTEKVFQCILLPDSLNVSKNKWFELQIVLKRLGIESKWYSYFSNRKKENCSGLMLSIESINHFSAFNTLLTVLQFFRNSGVTLAFSSNFDRALGGSLVREFLEGRVQKDDFQMVINRELRTFFNRASGSFLYRPLPKLIML